MNHLIAMRNYENLVNTNEIVKWLDQDWKVVQPKFQECLKTLDVLHGAVNVLQHEQCLRYLSEGQRDLLNRVLKEVIIITQAGGGNIMDVMEQVPSLKPRLALLITSAADIVQQHNKTLEN